jgi:hypothetical protein
MSKKDELVLKRETGSMYADRTLVVENHYDHIIFKGTCYRLPRKPYTQEKK